MGDELNLRELLAVIRERDPDQFDKIAAQLKSDAGRGRGRPGWISSSLYRQVWISFETERHFSRIKTNTAVAQKVAGNPHDPDSGIIGMKMPGHGQLEVHQWNNAGTLERLYREAKNYLAAHGEDPIDYGDLSEYPPSEVAKLPETLAAEWREALEGQIDLGPSD